MEIRPFTFADQSGLASLYRRGFPDEDLMPLVTALHDGQDHILSLVAERDATVIGHVLFSFACVEKASAALLAPLCVLPDHQRTGIGTALVRAGFAGLREEGTCAVYVLGDPTYYKRFGFSAECEVTPPYALPEEWRDAWQSFSFESETSALAGPLQVPEPWRDPALWLP